MNLKKRNLELLEILERFYNQSLDYFDDSEKEVCVEKISAHKQKIDQLREMINTINSSTDKDIEELVRIHLEILNKYFS